MEHLPKFIQMHIAEGHFGIARNRKRVREKDTILLSAAPGRIGHYMRSKVH